jgi:DNA-binding response OmpR family regulator
VEQETDKKTVLLIDDEVDLVEAVAFQLRAKRGYQVEVAYNGLEGLEKLKTITPHLIVLDMNMPKMGGLEFYKNISDSDGKSRYPVLVLTARANLEQLFRDLNVDGFMTKPFDLEKLFSEIDVIIRKRYPPVIPAKESVGVSKPIKVLIAEDSEAEFNKIAITFLNAGYVVSCAKNGMAAVDKAMSDPPDILLMKLGLSDLPGDLVVAKLKQMPKTMDVIFILFTWPTSRLDFAVTNKICEKIGIRKLVETNEPNVLLRETEIALKEARKL